MFEWMVLTLLFLFVSIVTFSAYRWVLERRARAETRDRTADLPIRDASSVMILGGLTPVLAGQSPIAKEKKPEIRQELRQAGYYHNTALVEYQAIRAVLVLLPLVICGALALVANRQAIPRVAAIGAVLAALGFSVPRLYINYLARRRAAQIERGLPLTVDLLNLGLSGGQNINAALASTAREVRYSFPLLADELHIIKEQAELSRLNIALAQFADRTGHPDVRNLAMALAQTERLGSDISAGLLEYTNNLRTNMRHRVEARANRASFWMLFPTILFLWIPATLVLFAPAFHEMYVRRAEFRNSMGPDKVAVEGINKAPARSGTNPPRFGLRKQTPANPQ